jgi:hypothetical protein
MEMTRKRDGHRGALVLPQLEYEGGGQLAQLAQVHWHADTRHSENVTTPFVAVVQALVMLRIVDSYAALKLPVSPDGSLITKGMVPFDQRKLLVVWSQSPVGGSVKPEQTRGLWRSEAGSQAGALGLQEPAVAGREDVVVVGSLWAA